MVAANHAAWGSFFTLVNLQVLLHDTQASDSMSATTTLHT